MDQLELFENKLEWKIGKYLRLVCDLKIGDRIYVNDEWGYQLKGKECIIEDIKFIRHGETGVSVKIDQYKDYIDSNWVNKIKS